MCGIVGYIGTRQAYSVLIKGLSRLEYRGYDSAGVALINENKDLNIYKVKGKVIDLKRESENKDISGCIGIGHTRWATHGEPNTVNAHPHCSQSGKLALVHNGIIENYVTLKAKLESKGYHFKSETDTEVLVQLIDYVMEKHHLELMPAVQVAMDKVEGAYAIAIIEKDHPEEIVVAKKSSPLVIGVGENNEYFLASDATPIVEYTDKVVYLKDGEVASIGSKSGLKIENLDNVTISPEIKKVTMDIGLLEKQGFPHFMLKEIYDQPKRITDCMRGRVNPKTLDVVLSAEAGHPKTLPTAQRLIILATGTSFPPGPSLNRLLRVLFSVPPPLG